MATRALPKPEEQHLDTIANIHTRAGERVGHHQRRVESVALQVGRPRTVYLMFGAVAAWVLVNCFMAKPIDAPPFFWMQGVLGLYAAFVTTIVLTVQNRQQKHVEQKSYLELQVNLSAEQKTAKIIALLEELRRDLPNVENRRDTQAEALAQAVDTGAVMSALERRLEREDPGDGA